MNISTRITNHYHVGRYIIHRFRNRLQEVNKTREPTDPSAHYTVAKQLRKMGFPIEIALYILVRNS